MANKETKLEFANRLNFALDSVGIPRKGKGRQDLVAAMFGVTRFAARKWLEGEAFPETARLQEISEKLSVSYEWLISGGSPMQSPAISAYLPSANKHPHFCNIPIIAWDMVHSWQHSTFDPAQHTHWLIADIEDPAYYFSLMVHDNTFEPTLPKNAYLVVNTSSTPQNNAKVIIWWKKTNQSTCYTLKFDGPNIYLCPLNPEYKSIYLDNPDDIQICGVLEQIFIMDANR